MNSRPPPQLEEICRPSFYFLRKRAAANVPILPISQSVSGIKSVSAGHIAILSSRDEVVIVSHLNSLVEGGAATAAQRLHMELIRQGFDSRFFHAERANENLAIACHEVPRWNSDGWTVRLRSILNYRLHRHELKRAARRSSSGHELFTSPKSAIATPWPPINLHDGYSARSFDEPLVIHLHWIARFLDYSSFFHSLPTGQPVVWTLHDMNPFTGGCHLAGGCERFRRGCGNCPQLKKPHDDDISRQAFVEKQNALTNLELHIVAPTRWILDQAKSSLMFRGAKSFQHIPHGIPTDDYYPMDRSEARARLGLSPDAFIIGYKAIDRRNHRKGASELYEALSKIHHHPNVECLVFGGDRFSCETPNRPITHHIGPVQGILQLRTVYSATDVMVLPSLENNLPLTGLEAMACGVPVVAFKAGGMPDFVRPGETGLLADTGDSQQLYECLQQMVDNPNWTRELGLNSRTLIEREYASASEARTYASLYNSLTRPLEMLQRQAA